MSSERLYHLSKETKMKRMRKAFVKVFKKLSWFLLISGLGLILACRSWSQTRYRVWGVTQMVNKNTKLHGISDLCLTRLLLFDCSHSSKLPEKVCISAGGTSAQLQYLRDSSQSHSRCAMVSSCLLQTRHLPS